MSIIEKISSIDHAISVAELASLLNLGRTAIYDMVHRGAIPSFRVGYSVRFDPHEIAEWLRDRSHRLPKSSSPPIHTGTKHPRLDSHTK
jgi:excisionase family DNA binding protein